MGTETLKYLDQREIDLAISKIMPLETTISTPVPQNLYFSCKSWKTSDTAQKQKTPQVRETRPRRYSDRCRIGAIRSRKEPEHRSHRNRGRAKAGAQIARIFSCH